MRVKRSEIAVALLGVSLGLVFLFSNVWGIGVGLLSADALLAPDAH